MIDDYYWIKIDIIFNCGLQKWKKSYKMRTLATKKRDKENELEKTKEEMIIFPPSESRKYFLTPKFKDPRNRLQEIPIIQAN